MVFEGVHPAVLFLRITVFIFQSLALVGALIVLRRKGMNVHWQNLNEKPGNRLGSGVRHGRCWIGPFEICWQLFQAPSFHLGVGIADYDCALSAALCLIVFSLFVNWRNHKVEWWLKEKTKRRGQKYGDGREIKLYWYQWGLWWTLWGDPMESRSKDSWFVRMHHWNFPDILFGSSEYCSRTIREERVIVPMPEAGYPALVKINEDTWKRPRWPFPRVMIRAELIPDTPIPFPGKGENAWDCGEDAMFSHYGPHDTSLKAVVAAVESVMESRLRHGAGWNYKPEEKGGDTNDIKRKGRAET